MKSPQSNLCLGAITSLAIHPLLFAGPLDENRAAPLASDRLVFQTRAWRVSMMHEKRLVGLVALVSASGDTVQFSTHSGGSIAASWSQLPPAVQETFASDRASLLFQPNLSVEESLNRAGAKGILGRVVQKLPEGLLVALQPAGYRTEFTFYGSETQTISSRDIPAPGPEMPRVVVRNHPDESTLSIDATISVVGFLQSNFPFEGRTLPVFSTTLTPPH